MEIEAEMGKKLCHSSFCLHKKLVSYLYNFCAPDYKNGSFILMRPFLILCSAQAPFLCPRAFRKAFATPNLVPRYLTIRSQRMSSTPSLEEKFAPAKRVAGQKQDVWSIVNEAAAASPVQPIVNMGQGFFGYNPPQFVIDAAKDALNKVDCNQYSPTKGRPRLKKAIADAYTPFFGRTLNPETEVTITTGANEGRTSMSQSRTHRLI